MNIIPSEDGPFEGMGSLESSIVGDQDNGEEYTPASLESIMRRFEREMIGKLKSKSIVLAATVKTLHVGL